MEIAFHIQLIAPPSGVLFGVQKGSGSAYVTLDPQMSEGGDMHFSFAVKIKELAEGIDFQGPIVQGKPGERFVYLDIGGCAGQMNGLWSRRLKVPLRGISREMIAEYRADEGSVFETIVPGKAKDGGPNCATVKPFAGWSLRKRAHFGDETKNDVV
jgi:hypothetical protein